MQNLLNTIDRLEEKQDNGTITMDESTTLIKLIQIAEDRLSGKGSNISTGTLTVVR